MARRRRGRGQVTVLLACAMLSACDAKETGHVQLQISPASAATTTTTTLYLDGKKLDFSRGPTVILRFPTGTISLKTANSYFDAPICKIAVQNNRLSVLTVVLSDAPPRCLCQIRAPDSTPDQPICS